MKRNICFLFPTWNKSWLQSKEIKEEAKSTPPLQAHEEAASPYEAEGGTKHGVVHGPIPYKKTYVCNMHRDGFWLQSST